MGGAGPRHGAPSEPPRGRREEVEMRWARTVDPPGRTGHPSGDVGGRLRAGPLAKATFFSSGVRPRPARRLKGNTPAR